MIKLSTSRTRRISNSKRSTSKGTSKTPSGAKVSRKTRSHSTWEFRPKLKNEAIVLYSTYSGHTIEFYSRCVESFRSLITKLVQNHGYADGSARYKIIRSYTFDLIEGRKPDNPAWLSTSEKFSVPSQLGPEIIRLVVEFLQLDKDDKDRLKIYQLLNILLYSSRIIEGLVPMSLCSIEDDFKPIDSDLLKDFTAYAENKLKNWKFNKANLEREGKSNLTDLSKYRFNLKKNGPNRMPKVESAHQEAVRLKESKLYMPFVRFCEELDISYLPSYLEGLVKVPDLGIDDLVDTNHDTHLRVLSPVPDSDFKTRMVAVVDFWTQLALEPVRAWVRHVTKALFNEMNFVDSHDRGFEALKAFQGRCLSEQIQSSSETLNIEKLRFYDFTSWTDRYHRDLQKSVMSVLFTPRLSEAWGQLVVHCSWYVPSAKREVKYKQGQGMGTNGSFDIATLTDHIFINFIYDRYCSDIYIPEGNRCYGKVGDDLWIYDPKDVFVSFYEKINLPINMSKSKTFCELGSVGEFCSRISINGTDVSRVSPGIISKSGNFRNIPTLLNVCAKVGIQLHKFDFEELDLKVKNTEKTYFDQLQDYLLGAYIVGGKDPELFGAVSIDYLEAGGWISDDFKEIVQNQTSLNKVILSSSIAKLLTNERQIEAKLSQISVGKVSIDIEERMQIISDNMNFFDIQSDAWCLAKKFFTTDYLTPKNIIILERFVDQLRATSEAFSSGINLYNMRDPMDLYYYVDSLSQAVIKSCYDSGSLKYDRSKWHDEIFAMTKVIDRLSPDKMVLYLETEDEVMEINSLLNYDSLRNQFLKEIPDLQVKPRN